MLFKNDFIVHEAIITQRPCHLWLLEIILENFKYLHLRHNSHDPIWSSHHPWKPADLVCHLCLISEMKRLVQGQVTTQKRTQSPEQESRELCYLCGAPGKEWCSDRLKNNSSLHISNRAYISDTVFVEESPLVVFWGTKIHLDLSPVSINILGHSSFLSAT